MVLRAGKARRKKAALLCERLVPESLRVVVTLWSGCMDMSRARVCAMRASAFHFKALAVENQDSKIHYGS